MKNNRKKLGWHITETAECAFSSSVTLWPWPLTFAPIKVYSCSTSYYLSTGQIWERLDEKWRRNHRTQIVGKKKKRQHNNRKVFRLCRQTLINLMYVKTASHIFTKGVFSVLFPTYFKTVNCKWWTVTAMNSLQFATANMLYPARIVNCTYIWVTVLFNSERIVVFSISGVQFVVDVREIQFIWFVNSIVVVDVRGVQLVWIVNCFVVCVRGVQFVWIVNFNIVVVGLRGVQFVRIVNCIIAISVRGVTVRLNCELYCRSRCLRGNSSFESWTVLSWSVFACV